MREIKPEKWTYFMLKDSKIQYYQDDSSSQLAQKNSSMSQPSYLWIGKLVLKDSRDQRLRVNTMRLKEIRAGRLTPSACEPTAVNTLGYYWWKTNRSMQQTGEPERIPLCKYDKGPSKCNTMESFFQWMLVTQLGINTQNNESRNIPYSFHKN